MTRDLHDQVRDAFAARTADIARPAEPDWTAVGRPRRMSRMAAPVTVVAAALLVAAVAFAGLHRSTPRPDLTAQRFPSTGPVLSVKPATSPRFIFRLGGAGGNDPVSAAIMDIASARVVGNVKPPAGYSLDWEQVTAAADNRTFFFSVTAEHAKQLYVAEVQVDDRGRPGVARVVAEEPVAPVVSTLVASPDATRLALGLASAPGKVVVWDLRTRRGRVWTGSDYSADLAWAADSRHLRWAAGTAARPTTISLDTQVGGAVYDPSDRMAVTTPKPSAQGQAAVQSALLPNADELIETSGSTAQLSLVSTADGSRRILDQWTDSHGQLESPIVDGAGQHVLYVRNGAWEELDLRSGRRSPVSLPNQKGDGYSYAW